MYDKEAVSNALQDYSKKKPDSIPEILEGFLRNVARTGQTMLPWNKVRFLFIEKTDQAMRDFEKEISMDSVQTSPNVEKITFEQLHKRILNQLKEFSGIPFTIQRLAELITDPKKHYKRTDKYLRGIEKNVNVVTTVDIFGNKVISDPVIMNGEEDGAEMSSPEGHSMNTSLFIPPPPVNSPATLADKSVSSLNGTPEHEAYMPSSSLFKDDAKSDQAGGDGATGVSKEEATEISKQQGCEGDSSGILPTDEPTTAALSSSSKDDRVTVQVEADSPLEKTKPDTATDSTTSEESSKEREAEVSESSNKREATSRDSDEPPEKRFKHDIQHPTSSQDTQDMDTVSVSRSATCTNNTTTSTSDASASITTTEDSDVTCSDLVKRTTTSITTATSSSEVTVAPSQSEPETSVVSACTSASDQTVSDSASDTSSSDSAANESVSTSSSSSTISSSCSAVVAESTVTSDVSTSTSSSITTTTVEDCRDKQCSVSSQSLPTEHLDKAQDQAGASHSLDQQSTDDSQNQSCASLEQGETPAGGKVEQEPMDTD